MDLIHDSVTEHVIIRQVAPSRILYWLRQALEDIQRAPADTLFYGVLFVLMGYILSYFFALKPAYVLALSTLFLLVGPFLGVGLYDLARQREGVRRHERVLLRHSMLAWRRNLSGFLFYAVLLTIVAVIWFRFLLFISSLFYTYTVWPSLGEMVTRLFNPQYLPFLFIYLGFGLFFAAMTFVASVIAVPMMLDKDVDAVTAMITSFLVVKKNIRIMTCWAFMILVLTTLGLVTYFVGLLFVMPLIGLASWHAYRDTVSFEH